MYTVQQLRSGDCGDGDLVIWRHQRAQVDLPTFNCNQDTGIDQCGHTVPGSLP